MPLAVEQMDLNLLGLPDLQDFYFTVSSELTCHRLVAQVRGPNCQDGIAQAVMGDAQEIEKRSADIQARLGIAEAYPLLAAVAYLFGHGDQNCGNYHTWACSVVLGNDQAFSQALPHLQSSLEKYQPGFMDIHPELAHAIACPIRPLTHFTATRIPAVQWQENARTFVLDWPERKSLIPDYGDAPHEVAALEFEQIALVSTTAAAQHNITSPWARE